MGNIRSKEELNKFLDKIESEVEGGPFSLRDSGIKEELHKKLESNAVRYDNEPVVACPHCNNLHLVDVDGKLECFNCGRVVIEEEVVVYKSIYHYLNESSNDTNDS